jgi:hypothetical protein
MGALLRSAADCAAKGRSNAPHGSGGVLFADRAGSDQAVRSVVVPGADSEPRSTVSSIADRTALFMNDGYNSDVSLNRICALAGTRKRDSSTFSHFRRRADHPGSSISGP